MRSFAQSIGIGLLLIVGWIVLAVIYTGAEKRVEPAKIKWIPAPPVAPEMPISPKPHYLATYDPRAMIVVTI